MSNSPGPKKIPDHPILEANSTYVDDLLLGLISVTKTKTILFRPTHGSPIPIIKIIKEPPDMYLTQAFQHLRLVLDNDVYQQLACVTHTIYYS